MIREKKERMKSAGTGPELRRVSFVDNGLGGEAFDP